MSTVISKNVQVGNSGTAAQNFTWYQPASPDGTVRLGVGNSGVTTGDVITANSSGVTVTGALTGSSLVVNGNNISAVNSLGFRNRLINSDMRIDQRNAGASLSYPASTYANCLDRWQAQNATDGAFTIQQATDAPTGFVNSLKFTTTTADASLAATQQAWLRQPIEGYNVADLAWGTASAATITLSFWVKSSLTGTFGGALTNNAENFSSKYMGI
jgi:hypothetical protein